MGRLLCRVRSELNKRPYKPNSSLSKSQSFENILPPSPKTPDHTSPHSSSERLSQPINSPSYKLVTDLSSNLSRTDINSSENPKISNTFHFTDFVSTGVYDEFSTYSRHGFNIEGEYWKSVQHYFQAQKFHTEKWLMHKIRSAVSSKDANIIANDYKKVSWESINSTNSYMTTEL